METQVVELLGRNRLIDELLRAGLEVAMPARDRGIDLIAYLDLDPEVGAFVAAPIQMKASSRQGFSISGKYAKFYDLILAFVWNLRSEQKTCTFALRYQEALDIGESMGWTKTQSWKQDAHYTTSRPSSRLRDLLEPHRMSAEAWRELVAGTGAA